MDDDNLIAALYRGRPGTIAEAAELTHLDPAELRVAVSRLRARGVLTGEDEVLAYIPPAEWAAALIAGHTESGRRAMSESMDGIQRIVDELPGLYGAWSIGETSSDPVTTLLRHGPHASEDLWFDLVRREAGTLVAVLPDVERFLDPPTERAMRFGRALAAKDRVRVVIPTESVQDPRARARVAAYQAAGVEYRLLDTPPSWFWVDGDYLAVPFEWGEVRPTSVVGVRHAALAGLVGSYFEELWRQAVPLGGMEEPWTPILRLMRKGITLETASRHLGINPRTGRRRIAAAMEHHGVSTLFALGAAWATDGAVRTESVDAESVDAESVGAESVGAETMGAV